MYAASVSIHFMWILFPGSQRPLQQSARLTLADTVVGDLKMDIPLGFILALIAVVLVKFLLDRTKMGYEMKAVGFSRSASRYAGINVGKNIVVTMLISGALAGLAGVTYYLGYFASIQPRVLSSTGFDAIAVSLLGNNNPVGIIFSSLLITVVDKGSTYMSSAAGIQAEIADCYYGDYPFVLCMLRIHQIPADTYEG